MLDHQHALPSERKDSASAPVLLCISDTFRVHPDIAVANLSRPIRSKIVCSQGYLTFEFRAASLQ
jgi:hypothetical protein